MSVVQTPRQDSPVRPGRGRELRGNWAGSDESRRWRLKGHGDGPANPKRTKQKSLAWTHHCGSITTRQPMAVRPAVQSHASGPDFDAEAKAEHERVVGVLQGSFRDTHANRLKAASGGVPIQLEWDWDSFQDDIVVGNDAEEAIIPLQVFEVE